MCISPKSVDTIQRLALDAAGLARVSSLLRDSSFRSSNNVTKPSPDVDRGGLRA
jgi:hypothetical protein